MMATDGVNTNKESEMVECDGEKVVTMMDVLQEQEEFEEDANAVLGASDEKNCTYHKGYIKRQALYACVTCCPEAKDDPKKRAGVCLACSLNCHENHELIELYTKRNFRCDCGNPKFNSHVCQYTTDKIELNENNEYNQNFSGLYCICSRPYPDPNNPVDEEMIQCIVCEDWLHSNHLDAVVPPNDCYAEMICKACMEKNEFLHDYSNFAVNVDNTEVDVTNGDVTKESIADDADNSMASIEINNIVSQANGEIVTEVKDVTDNTSTDDVPKESQIEGAADSNLKTDEIEKSEEISETKPDENVAPENTEPSAVTENKESDQLDENKADTSNSVEPTSEKSSEHKRKLSTEDTIEENGKKAKLEDTQCTRPKGVKQIYNGATFWPSTFRQKLCTCGECITMYTELAVMFLIDNEDTVSAYENLGKIKANGAPSQYEKGLEALSSLDRIQQINALTEYNNMRDKLLDFLKSFKDRKEIVKEEDIREFFAGMKPKREADGVYFCR